MKEYKKEKQSERLQPQQVCGYSTSTHVGFSVKLGLQQQLKKRKKARHESLVEPCRQVQVETEGGLKDKSRVWSGAGEGEIVRWAAFLSAEVMAEW